MGSGQKTVGRCSCDCNVGDGRKWSCCAGGGGRRRGILAIARIRLRSRVDSDLCAFDFFPLLHFTPFLWKSAYGGSILNSGGRTATDAYISPLLKGAH